MADDIKLSKSGVFLDTKTGEIVESQPEEGIQIVAPGRPLDATALAAIERERPNLTPTSPVDLSATGPAPEDTTKTVTTTKTATRK